MKSANAKRLCAEFDILCRLHDVTEDQLMSEIIGWIDYTYHGVVQLPLVDQPQEKPDEKPKART